MAYFGVQVGSHSKPWEIATNAKFCANPGYTSTYIDAG